MTRGPQPKKGLENAMSAAAGRGAVMRFMRETGNPCDFLIACSDQLVLVSVRKARRLSDNHDEVELEYQRNIRGLRSFPSSPQIVRELWTYSRRGIWRLFRIEQSGMVEICQDGTPLKNPFVITIRTVRRLRLKKRGYALVKGEG